MSDKRRQAISGRRAIELVALAVFIATGGGCVSLNPEHFLPKSIAPARSDQIIDGSVNVQAVLPDISRGMFYLSDDGKEAIVPDTRRGKVATYHSGMLRIALEKAITQKGLFQRIEQGDADYVLDVWVIEVMRLFRPLGEGYVIDITAIWRLTRAKDGKVIVCDFVTGHGASHGLGTNAFTVSIEVATREMIRTGLSKLSDRSISLSVMNIAGDWPSMGPVIPDGYKKMKENWSKLRKGLAEKDVRELITSMPTRSCTINRYFTDQIQERRQELFIIYMDSKVKGKDKEVKVLEPCGWNTKDVVVDFEIVGDSVMVKRILSVKEETFEPFYPFYHLAIVNGALERWSLGK